MASLAEKIIAVYPDIRIGFDGDVVVQDDGGGEFIAKWTDPRPIPTSEELDAAYFSTSFIVSKQQKQQSRIEAVIQARASGFQFNGHRVASDKESWMLIQGAVTMAQLALSAGTQSALDQFAATLGAGWRAIDQSIVATDAAGIIAMGQALAGHMAVCDAVSQAHKAAIDAAETTETVTAIDVTAGYQ